MWPTGPGTNSYSLRERKKPLYDLNAILAQVNTEDIASSFDARDLSELRTRDVIDVVLTQYGINKGLKLFKQLGYGVVKAAMQQLHDRHVMHPISPESLNEDKRSRSLNYLMFLKEKRDWNINGRGFADGSKQRAKTKKSTPPLQQFPQRHFSSLCQWWQNKDVTWMCSIYLGHFLRQI